MAEQLGVLCATTVGGGGYTAGSGVLNATSTSTGSGILPFPSTGTFSVVIKDASTLLPKALLEVTGINSSTQFAVTNSGGVDVNCNAGDIIQAVIDSRALTAILSGPSWTNLSPLYVNGWADLGAGYRVGQYTKDGTGRVWLRGVIKGGTITSGTTLFTMPAGFRPTSLDEYIAIGTLSGVTVAVAVDVLANGNVVLQRTLDSGSALVLTGISFSVN